MDEAVVAHCPDTAGALDTEGINSNGNYDVISPSSAEFASASATSTMAASSVVAWGLRLTAMMLAADWT